MRKLLVNLLKSKILRFLIIGGCSTSIDFAIYFFLSRWLHTAVSKGISMVASSIFSYFANKRFTFRNKERTDAWYLARFYTVFALNLLANISVNELAYRLTGYKILAFILATVAGMTVNYLGQRHFVFRDEPDGNDGNDVNS